MAQIINTNLISLNTQRNLTTTQGALALAVQRLSSGLRVNSAKGRRRRPGDRRADELAGARHERRDPPCQRRHLALETAGRWARSATCCSGCASSRCRPPTRPTARPTAPTWTPVPAARLADHRHDHQTKFSRTAILATGTAQVFQVGANVGDTISVAATDLSADATITAATGAGVTGADATNANAAMTAIDAALTTLNTQRANWGAVQNRFDAVIGSLQVATENQAAARGRRMGAAVAAETAALTRAQVLQQAGTAMLSQANSLPNGVLRCCAGRRAEAPATAAGAAAQRSPGRSVGAE